MDSEERSSYKIYRIVILMLKGLFNNVFIFKSLSCISVFDKVYKWSPEKIYLAIIKCFKGVNINKWPELHYSCLPVDCYVRINSKPNRLFSGDIQSYISW